MIGSVSVAVKILDVNDNPPSLTQYFEAFVCESAKAGQVQRHTYTHTYTYTWKIHMQDLNRGRPITSICKPVILSYEELFKMMEYCK